MQIPPALVLGCNTSHGINVLSDWIEEQTGVVPDFLSSGCSNGGDGQEDGNSGEHYDLGSRYNYAGNSYEYTRNYGYGVGYGNSYGNGRGHGDFEYEGWLVSSD